MLVLTSTGACVAKCRPREWRLLREWRFALFLASGGKRPMMSGPAPPWC